MLAADQKSSNRSIIELEGDIEALKLVDLDKEALSEYKPYLERLGLYSSKKCTESVSSTTSSHPCSRFFEKNNIEVPTASAASVYSSSQDHLSSKISFENGLYELRNLVEQIFRNLDRSNTGQISVQEAEHIILKLNDKLNRKYEECDIRAFFNQLDLNRDNLIDLNEFNTAFLNLAASTLINSID